MLLIMRHEQLEAAEVQSAVMYQNSINEIIIIVKCTKFSVLKTDCIETNKVGVNNFFK